MAVKATLRFKGDLPYHLEHLLCSKLGFRVKRRAGREWVEVEKLTPPAFPLEVLVNGELPAEVQETLIKRCNAVVDRFTDPEVHLRIITIRLNNVALTLPPFQRKFVHEWMARNLKEDQ